MIVKNNETELDVLVKHPLTKQEERLVVKVLPDRVNLTVGRFGRIKSKEVVGLSLPYDEGRALYQLLHRKYGSLDK